MKKVIFFLIALFFLLFRVYNSQEDNYLPEINSAEKNRDTLILSNSNEFIKIGWNQQNITPALSVRMVGKGWRKKFESVHDSLRVHIMILKIGNQQLAFISYDLLLITPSLYKSIVEIAHQKNISAIYVSASHSHSSFGGYGNTLAEKLVLGGQDKMIFQHILNQTKNAMDLALQNMEIVKNMSYCIANGGKVINRINDKEVSVAPLISLKWQTLQNQRLEILTFSAHPTILSSKIKTLSNDYPYWLTESEDENSTKMFMAGPMGSCSPFTDNQLSGFEKAERYAQSVQAQNSVCEALNFNAPIRFEILTIKNIRSSARVFKLFELRPFVTQWLWNNEQLHLDIVRIGNALLISLPCELSFTYYQNLLNYAKMRHLHLILTVFNGDYAGYCPNKIEAHVPHRETRYMNWLGENSGEFFYSLVQKIIEREGRAVEQN